MRSLEDLPTPEEIRANPQRLEELSPETMEEWAKLHDLTQEAWTEILDKAMPLR